MVEASVEAAQATNADVTIARERERERERERWLQAVIFLFCFVFPNGFVEITKVHIFQFKTPNLTIFYIIWILLGY